MTDVLDNDGGGGTTSMFSDQLTTAKISAVLLLGLGSFVVGLVPLKLVQMWNRTNVATVAAVRTARRMHTHGPSSIVSPIISALLCFGGGVLLSTTMLHLQPEVRAQVVQLQHDGRLPDGHQLLEHLADLIFCAGFFVVYIVDELVHWAVDRFAEDHAQPGTGTVHRLHRSMSLRRRAQDTVLADRLDVESVGNRDSIWTTISLDTAAGPDTAVLAVEPPIRERRDGQNGVTLANGMDDDGPAVPSFGHLFAVIALSFHEVIEGLTIGLMVNVNDTWYLLGAVAMHKLAIGFCIGQELAWSGTSTWVTITYVATFSFVTPVGIAIGTICLYLNSTDESSGPLTVVLQGLSAGTLLYVVFFEVFTKHRKPGLWCLVAIVTGFAVMLMLHMISKYMPNYNMLSLLSALE